MCYVLAYRAPDYIRTRTLLAALNTCAGVRTVSAINAHTGIRRYAETLKRLKRVREEAEPDIYLLGFRGHEIFWLVKAIVGKKPLIVDALMSPSAALRDENRLGLLGRLLAPVVGWLEAAILRRADLVLTDTHLHVAWYARAFGISESKMVAVPIGAVEAVQTCSWVTERAEGEFHVLFYGSFLPLHGMDIIIRAAAMLQDLPVYFDFIGGGKSHERRLRRSCEVHGVTRYSYRQWVPFGELLAREIPAADLCLGGPFGATPQACRVVTGKAAQCLALAKATVVGRIAEDFGFVDHENCLLIEQGNADSLSRAIRWAFENRSLLGDIGQAGRNIYEKQLSIHVAARRLADTFRRVGLDVC